MKKQALFCTVMIFGMVVILLFAVWADSAWYQFLVQDNAYTSFEEESEDIHLNSEDGLVGKKAIFLGDSICAGTTVGEDSPQYGYGWAGLIGEANDMNWKNYGRNGGTVTPIPTVAESKRDLISQLEIARREYETVDYVIVEGGVNDADLLKEDPSNLGVVSDGLTGFDSQTFSGALELLFSTIWEAYPSAKIGYIIPPKMGNGPYDAQHNVRRQYFDRAIEICEKWEIDYIDLWKNSLLDPSLEQYYDESQDAVGNIADGKCYTDGQHLTLEGYKQIVPSIEAFMKRLSQ